MVKGIRNAFLFYVYIMLRCGVGSVIVLIMSSRVHILFCFTSEGRRGSYLSDVSEFYDVFSAKFPDLFLTFCQLGR